MSFDKTFNNTIGEVTDSCLGKMLDAKKNKGKYAPYLANVNVRWGAFDLSDLPQMRFEENEQERYGIRYGDIIMCEGGEPGRCAIWRDEIPGMKIQKALHRIRTKEQLDNEYLYYWFLNEGRKGSLDAYFTGSTIKHLPGEKLKSILITYPDISVQHRIASVLSMLDAKIKINTQINNNLLEQARLLFQSWFIDYEPFGGVAPLEWKQSTLGQIATMKTDSWSPTKNPNVVVEHYSIPAYDEQHFPVFEVASGIKSNKYILTPDSVMISKLNPDTKRIWRPMCLSSNPVCSTEFIVYEAKNATQRDFIYSILDSVPFLNHLCSHTTGSTNSRQRATPKSTLDYPIMLPSDSIIDEFCHIVTPMYDLVSSNTVENQSLSKARDSLLPKLMSGEIDTSNLDL